MTSDLTIGIPSEDEISSLAKDLWKGVKPSKVAQHIRSSIKLDSGKYIQAESDFIPSYVWDLVDAAAEFGLRVGDIDCVGKVWKKGMPKKGRLRNMIWRYEIFYSDKNQVFHCAKKLKLLDEDEKPRGFFSKPKQKAKC